MMKTAQVDVVWLSEGEEERITFPSLEEAEEWVWENLTDIPTDELETLELVTAANPYSSESNPYSMPAPGTPDDLLDGPPHVDPVQDIPMTTRPRQMPGSGGDSTVEVDPSLTPQEEVVLASLGSMPLRCASTGREFYSRVEPGMLCICGRRDFDLRTEGLRTWHYRVKMADGSSEYMELEFPYEKQAYDFAHEWWENDDNLVKITVEDGADRATPLVLDRNPRHPQYVAPLARRQAMEGDPQFTNHLDLLPDAAELPENDQFAVPFKTIEEYEQQMDTFRGEAKLAQRQCSMCERPATRYIMGPYAGDWGAFYCEFHPGEVDPGSIIENLSSVSMKAISILREVKATNPRLPFIEVVDVAERVMALAAKEDYIDQLAEEYNMTEADAEVEVDSDIEADPAIKEQWGIL